MMPIAPEALRFGGDGFVRIQTNEGSKNSVPIKPT